MSCPLIYAGLSLFIVTSLFVALLVTALGMAGIDHKDLRFTALAMALIFVATPALVWTGATLTPHVQACSFAHEEPSP